MAIKINDTAATNTILGSNGHVQKTKGSRNKLLTKNVLDDLNTYRNFGIFPSWAETYYAIYLPQDITEVYYERDPKGEKDANGKVKTQQKTRSTTKYLDVEQDYENGANGPGTPGVRSIFNRSGTVIMGAKNNFDTYYMRPEIGDEWHTNQWRISNNVPLMDSPKARQRIRAGSGCSVKELVEASQKGLMGKETYAYSDFMYCKNLGKVSNNYMITLRRFPGPVDDYIGAVGETHKQKKKNSSKNISCIGCMVTWMGVSGNEMSNILKYNYKQAWKEEESQMEDVEMPDADASTGLLSGMFAIFDSQYRAQYQAGVASTAANRVFDHFGVHLGEAPYKHLAKPRNDRTKIWGPIDSIRTVYMRADKGLTYEQKFTLVFEYELRSYNGINGKQAMLDLISNILNVTYTTGDFWAGGYRGFGAHQSNIFANLNIFKASGGFSNFVDAFAKDISNLKDRITNYFRQGDPVSQLLKLLDNIGGMIMSGLLNKLGRPQKGYYNALLSPAPVGLWHVTIGNPKRPIMSIGNMIITNCQVEHNGLLGIDDFPTGIKVTVDLDRGKARDLRDIEKLYMQGNDRIYSSMNEKIFDMYKNAQEYKSLWNKKANKQANVDDMHSYTPRESQYNTILQDEEIPSQSDAPALEITEQTLSKQLIDSSQIYSSLDENDKLLEYLKTMTKYFGTDDLYDIYIPAAEQEWGSSRVTESQKAAMDAGYGTEN